MTNLSASSKCLLDGKQEVIIVKSFNKLSTKYVVETRTKSVILVERDRLKPVDEKKEIFVQAA